MNIKVILGGGLALYVTQFIVSMPFGMFVHQGILVAPYQAHAESWRPELNQVPPDMAALMPLWLTTGLIGALVIAAIYTVVRDSFSGSDAINGAKYGLTVWGIVVVVMMGLSGVFSLPYVIWTWWAIENLCLYVIGGAVLGIVAGKLDPRTA